MEINNIVIVSFISPKEKMWGQICCWRPRALPCGESISHSFDDFIRQVVQQEETAVGLNTVFFPMHRVERIMVDEPSGSIPSLSQRFQAKVGLTIQEYLGIDDRAILSWRRIMICAEILAIVGIAARPRRGSGYGAIRNCGEEGSRRMVDSSAEEVGPRNRPPSHVGTGIVGFRDFRGPHPGHSDR